MNPFYDGPLRHFTEQLRHAGLSPIDRVIPDVIADSSDAGRKARDLLTYLTIDEQESLSTYYQKKAQDERWVAYRHNREAIKVVLDELSLSALGAAQELGLTFATALTKVPDPWMRILVNLELAELLSRTHTYAPACALAYTQTFRQFDSYLEREEFKTGADLSLFEPLALAGGDIALARELAIEAILPYGEDALRLLWGLQVREQQAGNKLSTRTFRNEEAHLAHKLREWSQSLSEIRHASQLSWHTSLMHALEISSLGDGMNHIYLRDTSRTRAAGVLVQDVHVLTRAGDYHEALKHLDILQPALLADQDLEFSQLKDHRLHADYLRVIVSYHLHRQGFTSRSEDDSKEEIRQLWCGAERLHNEPGSLWQQGVSEARTDAIREIPKDWRFTPLSTA